MREVIEILFGLDFDLDFEDVVFIVLRVEEECVEFVCKKKEEEEKFW